MLFFSGCAAKSKWKTLRDGYLRYRRSAKGSTGAEKTNCSYIWAEQLKFLEDSLKPKQSASNVKKQQNHTENVLILEDSNTGNSYTFSTQNTPPISTTVSTDYLLPPASNYKSTPVTETYTSYSYRNTTTPTRTLLTPRKVTHVQDDSLFMSPTSPSYITGDTCDYIMPCTSRANSDIIIHPNINHSFVSPTESPPRTAPRRSKQETEVDKAISYLKNKNNKFGEAEYLFMSYASAFQKLSKQKQGEIKIKMAQMFVEAERSDANNYAPQLSPTYTTVSYNLDNSQEARTGGISDLHDDGMIEVDIPEDSTFHE